MRAALVVSSLILLTSIAGCTPREEFASPAVVSTAATRASAERSYLDVGPAPGRGGPAYLQANTASGPRQTDFFGNDVLPRAP
jgi:hypothetical protein